MNEVIIFATSILINYLRTGRHKEQLESITGLVRTSAVVLSELWRGASKRSERDFLIALQRNHPVLTPTQKHWIQSGQLLNHIYSAKGFAPEKLRDLHFDVLIALTARGVGGRLITSNRVDFETIREHQNFNLEVW